MTGLVFLFYCNWAVLLCLSVQAYENLALHQPAWQNSIHMPYTADLAVDGQYTEPCALSDGGLSTAKWWVDLGGLKNINHVLIHYFDYYPEDLLGFSVHISNTTSKKDGVLCFRDTNFTRATIPNPVNITCPYHGRYVIYYNNRTHPPYPFGYSFNTAIVLCEVEVYGCRSLRNYGDSCSLECPQNCQDDYCDIVEGTFLACKTGFKGPRCDLECLVGFHGVNCLQNCSMTCGIPGSCDRITGYCNGGCQRGWTGVRCEKDRYKLRRILLSSSPLMKN